MNSLQHIGEWYQTAWPVRASAGKCGAKRGGYRRQAVDVASTGRLRHWTL